MHDREGSMASKLIKFCIIHHHILRLKTTIEIGKEENHLGQLSGGEGGTSSKGEKLAGPHLYHQKHTHKK